MLKRRAALLAIALWILVGIAAIFALTWQAKAQGLTPSLCMLRADMMKTLAKEHNEHRIGQGIVNDYVMEMTLADNGSWSVYLVRTDGLACIVASGTDWQFIPEEQPSH
jgi:hypothetical protein